MPRLSLFALPRAVLAAASLALLLAACGGETEEKAQAPPPPPLSEDVAAVAEPVTLPQAPGVVVDLDPAFLMRATLSRDGRQYRLDQVDEQWEVDGDPGAEVGAWLERYDPLRADGLALGLVPDSVIFSPDAQVSFFFTDGSGRVVSYKRYGDSLAVVGQPNGPVYRIASDRLDALVPAAEAF